MTTPIYIIYKHTCIITGKSYIGQTSNSASRRWKRHISEANKNSPFHFHRAIRKHCQDNFIHEILFETTNQSIINKKEIEYIAKYDTYHNGYNMTIGGEATRGYKHTEKTKLKMSESHSGENNSMYGIISPMYGKKHSEETKRKMSKAQLGEKHPRWKGYYHTPWGKYTTSKTGANKSVSQSSIKKWCKTPDKIITQQIINCSKYLKRLEKSPLGKTFKDIGFDFYQ